MSIQISPRLRRADVMLNSFGSRIADTPEKSTGTPEMSFSEILSQPRMFMQEFKGAITFKQLQGFADGHCWRQFNKQVDMVNCNMQFVNFTSVFDCDFIQKSFAINFHSKKFKWVPSILGFPDKMEGILPEGVLKMFQIHFFAPKVKASKKAHANFVDLFHEPNIKAHLYSEFKFYKEDGNSSIGLKVEVSLPLM